ncbi:MAG: Gfo/Idh/MocA family oxidoreductase [Anaerolineae bacterium]|nr:Gfo/Idh/MocA family oxidoreductase [Anaerolineae bacterium]
MTEDRIRVAVVGGGIGRTHLAAYRALPHLFDVVAVCGRDRTRTSARAEEFAVPRVVCSMDELCAMDGLDVIDICTPSHLHEAQTLQVLAAGKHAICEKPLAGSLAAMDRLAEAEVRSGRRVMPIFNYRFGAGVQKLRHLIAQGITGRPYLGTIEVAWRRRADYYAVDWRGHWQTELGGTLTTHAIHFLDQLLYLLGPVRNVFARTATLVNPIETEDCASASLEMASGALASVSVTLGSSVEISRQRYCFANLVAESNLAPYNKNTQEPWQFVADTPEAEARLAAALASFVPGPEGFVGQFAGFAEALRNGTELPVTLADARRAIELLTALYASARTRAAVDLPIGPEHPFYEGWLP